VNFLSHHVVALAHGGDRPAEFYVGNVLPDLVSTSGEGRLRAPDGSGLDSLLDGIALHMDTDRRFHGAPAFADARALAKSLLLAVPFAVPPRRTFFLVHAAVEIALDGWLLRDGLTLADDFYARFAAADLPGIVTETAALMRLDGPPLALARTIDRFVESRYLYHYAEPHGQAEALVRLCRRIGIADFAADSADRDRLDGFFGDLMRALAPLADSLLLRDLTAGRVVK